MFSRTGNVPAPVTGDRPFSKVLKKTLKADKLLCRRDAFVVILVFCIVSEKLYRRPQATLQLGCVMILVF